MGCANHDGLGLDQWPQGVHQVREGGDGLEAAFVSSERQQRVGEGASAGCMYHGEPVGTYTRGATPEIFALILSHVMSRDT